MPLLSLRTSALSALIVIAGCANLRLPTLLRLQPGDWPMYAMTEERVATVLDTLVPPLRLEWDQDVQAGVGNGSPVIVDSIVFVTNLRGDLHAIHVRTGKRVGSVNLGEAIQGSPVIGRRTALLALSNTAESLVQFDFVDGKPGWKRRYGDIEMSPLLFDRKVYVGNTEGMFFCVEPATGDSIWRYSIPDNDLRKGYRSSPAGWSSVVAVGSDNGFVYAFDAASGSLRWKFDAGSPVMATPCIVAGLVCVGTLGGVMIALDVSTGAERWRFSAGSPLYATPSETGNVLIFGSIAGTMFALRIADGTVAWTTSVEGPVNAMAVVSGSHVYVGTLKRKLIALRVADGTVVWSTELSGRVKTAPAIAFGRLFVVTDDRDILSFRSTAP